MSVAMEVVSSPLTVLNFTVGNNLNSFTKIPLASDPSYLLWQAANSPQARGETVVVGNDHGRVQRLEI